MLIVLVGGGGYGGEGSSWRERRGTAGEELKGDRRMSHGGNIETISAKIVQDMYPTFGDSVRMGLVIDDTARQRR